MKRISRRSALGAGLAAPLAFLGNQAEAADRSTPFLYSAGFFEVPRLDQILIGLLLPAVQAARAPARLLLVNSLGESVEIALPAVQKGMSTAFFHLSLGNGNEPSAQAVDVFIQEEGSNRTFTLPSPDGVLIAVLLPAVQRQQSGPGLLAGSVQRLSDGRVLSLLPFIEQENLFRPSSRPSHEFVGPFLAAPESDTQVGLLLPAVQKVREAARFAVLNHTGAVIAQTAISTEEAKGPMLPVFFEILRQGNTAIVNERLGDGSVRPISSGPTNGILIGLLLPAVQKVREAALGGSLQTGELAVGLTRVSAG